MDLNELQGRLRLFASERNWEKFHSPKNLLMALMVEAAKLMELFQWLTPEESRTAKHDSALKLRIGAELSDVLLYLLQLADQTFCKSTNESNRCQVSAAKKERGSHKAQNQNCCYGTSIWA